MTGPEKSRVGILGAGQLAQMLVQAARRLALPVTVLAIDSNEPAVQAGADSVLGSFSDEAALTALWRASDVITFENEFIDCEAARRVSAQFPHVRVVPPLHAIEQLRDKASQKELLQRLGIPTSPFHVLPENTEPQVWVASLANRFPAGAVIKWGRMGYDGKGLVFLRDFSKDPLDAVNFCQEAIVRGVRCYAESLVPFRRELALLLCRSISGESVAYPLVVSEQTDGVCDWIVGPASAFGTTPEQEKIAASLLTQIAEATGMVGCMAAEFFELENGALWINELAPRVHNSAHYTQNAAATDQFENHLRAVLGWPLGKVTTAPAFAMANLLGPEGVLATGSQIVLPTPPPGTFLHWYGKNDIRPKRKVGHINVVAAHPGELKVRRLAVEKARIDWARVSQSSLKGFR